VKKQLKTGSKQLNLSLGSAKAPVEIYIDGASRGNPGRSGIGILIRDVDGSIHQIKKDIGIATNNEAEYKALITALQSAKGLKKNQLRIYTDSSLLANQINGNWQVRDPKIAVLYKRAKELISEFEKVKVEHIPRELNRGADRLANEAIDEYNI
jgi:ribonuclease HI